MNDGNVCREKEGEREDNFSNTMNSVTLSQGDIKLVITQILRTKV